MGKTMLTLFSSFSKDELCQLYVFPSTPNTELCHSYYRITDRDVLASYYHLKMGGNEIKTDLNCQSMFDDEKEKKDHCTVKNKKPIRGLARDLMWACSRWFSNDLKNWIEKENPSCIILIPGNAKFIYNIALRIAKKYKLPIVVYICDEYYFVKEPEGTLSKIKLKLFRNTVKKTMAKTAHVITICDELKELYSKEFNVPATTVMTGSSSDTHVVRNIVRLPQSINYFGNISINRYLSIADIGKVLDELNKEKNTNYHINVYSAETNPNILSVLSGIASIHLKGFIFGEEYIRTFNSSEALLHVEAFDEDSIDRVKNSVSTKIADSLGSGIPLFAYGPECIASMGHLIRNKCAICATSKDMIRDKILQLFNEPVKCSEIVSAALEVAESMHNEEKNSLIVYSILTKVCVGGIKNRSR